MDYYSCILLLFIAGPSFALLYSIDEVMAPQHKFKSNWSSMVLVIRVRGLLSTPIQEKVLYLILT